MYGDYPEELVPEPNTEADVRAYYFLERNDGEILDTLSPEQIRAIARTWHIAECFVRTSARTPEEHSNLLTELCDTAARIIDGTKDIIDLQREEARCGNTLLSLDLYTIDNFAFLKMHHPKKIIEEKIKRDLTDTYQKARMHVLIADIALYVLSEELR